MADAFCITIWFLRFIVFHYRIATIVSAVLLALGIRIRRRTIKAGLVVLRTTCWCVVMRATLVTVKCVLSRALLLWLVCENRATSTLPSSWRCHADRSFVSRRQRILPRSLSRVKVVAEGEKCERCWMVLPEVGTIAGHDGLCGRCADAVAAMPITAA